jgi:hypothetical protein
LVGHRVSARREGRAAILKCDACSEEQAMREGAFDGFNDFIQDHRDCALGMDS